MVNPAWISTAFSVGSPLMIAIFLWGRKQFLKKVDENKNETLTAVQKVAAQVHTLSTTLDAHTNADANTFEEHGTRLTRIEATLETLLTVMKNVIHVKE